jgi:GxxExxY protein
MTNMTQTEVNAIAYKVLGAAIEVHKFLGPGLLESTYQKCMEKELALRGLKFEAQKSAEIIYKGEKFFADLRSDILVEKCVVVELKAIDAIAPVHQAQVLTYMKLLSVPKGLLINFNCHNIFREGQKAFVNDIFAKMAA